MRSVSIWHAYKIVPTAEYTLDRLGSLSYARYNHRALPRHTMRLVFMPDYDLRLGTSPGDHCYQFPESNIAPLMVEYNDFYSLSAMTFMPESYCF